MCHRHHSVWTPVPLKGDRLHLAHVFCTKIVSAFRAVSLHLHLTAGVFSLSWALLPRFSVFQAAGEFMCAHIRRRTDFERFCASLNTERVRTGRQRSCSGELAARKPHIFQVVLCCALCSVVWKQPETQTNRPNALSKRRMKASVQTYTQPDQVASRPSC